MVEIVYTWPNGRQEVRYRRPTGSDEANRMINEVERMRAQTGQCPYSWRYANE